MPLTQMPTVTTGRDNSNGDTAFLYQASRSTDAKSNGPTSNQLIQIFGTIMAGR